MKVFEGKCKIMQENIFNFFHTSTQTHMHQGKALKEFLFNRKVNKTKLIQDMNTNESAFYRMLKRERIPDEDLKLLKELTGFDLKESEGKSEKPTKIQDSPVSEFLDETGDKELFGGFAVRIYEKFKSLDNLTSRVNQIDESIKDHEVRIDMNAKALIGVQADHNELADRVKKLEEIHHE